MLQIDYNLALHLEFLQHVVHMDAAHADQVPANRIDVMGQVERKEWNVDVLPFYGLEQVQH